MAGLSEAEQPEIAVEVAALRDMCGSRRLFQDRIAMVWCAGLVDRDYARS
jgi:hypothetical protein